MIGPGSADRNHPRGSRAGQVGTPYRSRCRERARRMLRFPVARPFAMGLRSLLPTSHGGRAGRGLGAVGPPVSGRPDTARARPPVTGVAYPPAMRRRQRVSSSPDSSGPLKSRFTYTVLAFSRSRAM